MINMNKLLLAIGTILCLAGLILISSSNKSVKSTQLSLLPLLMEEQEQDWMYSVNLNVSEIISIEIGGPEDNPNIWWYNDLYEPEIDSNTFWNPYAPVKLNVTLIPPDNVETIFCVWFVWDYLEGLTVKNLELLSEKTSTLENLSLTYTPKIGVIRGVVREDGTYRFYVRKWYWMKVGGTFYPPELKLFKELIVYVNPYSNILPLGIGILSLGVSVSLFGFFKRSRRRYIIKGKRTKQT